MLLKKIPSKIVRFFLRLWSRLTGRKYYEKIGQIKPKRGHKLYEFNYVTKTLEEVKTQTVNGRKKYITQPDCIYVSALNKQNAAKKILKKLDL